MADVVVTVPKGQWQAWIAEGDLPGQPDTCERWEFTTGGGIPNIRAGERVYIVAHGKLRGYASLVTVKIYTLGRIGLVRSGGAVAVTIDAPIRGFQAWRYRWWDRGLERPFPEWKTEGVA